MMPSDVPFSMSLSDDWYSSSEWLPSLNTSWRRCVDLRLRRSWPVVADQRARRAEGVLEENLVVLCVTIVAPSATNGASPLEWSGAVSS